MPGKYFQFQYIAKPGSIELDVQHKVHHLKEPLPLLDEVKVFGVSTAVQYVSLRRQVRSASPARNGLPPPPPPPPPEGLVAGGGGGRDALEGEGPQRRPQKPLGRRLEEVAKAVGGGYCRLQLPLKPALGVRETVAGHGLGALGLEPPRHGAPPNVAHMAGTGPAHAAAEPAARSCAARGL